MNARPPRHGPEYAATQRERIPYTDATDAERVRIRGFLQRP